MRQEGSCGPASKAEANDGYEVVRIEKTKNRCRLCEDYADRRLWAGMVARPGAGRASRFGELVARRRLDGGGTRVGAAEVHVERGEKEFVPRPVIAIRGGGRERAPSTVRPGAVTA